MTQHDTNYLRRIARMRRQNPLPAAAPPALYAHAPIMAKQRRVGKAGSVTIGAGLAQGVKVTVVELDRQTYIVSSRPMDEVQKIAAGMPRAAASPFAALSDSLKGRKHDLSGTRQRGPYAGPITMPSASDEDVLRNANVQRTRRVR